MRRCAGVRNDAKTNAAIAAAGQGARSSLWGSRGEISPLRGATKRRPARPEKGAQWRRKRFRKTAHIKLAHSVDGESGFVENSRQESSGGSRTGQKLPRRQPAKPKEIVPTPDDLRRIVKSGEPSAARRTRCRAAALPRVWGEEPQKHRCARRRFCFAQRGDVASKCLATGLLRAKANVFDAKTNVRDGFFDANPSETGYIVTGFP